MAIKVKKKDKSKAEDVVVEVLDGEGEDTSAAALVPEAGYRLKKGNWAEENPQAIVGLVVIAILAILGIYYGIQYAEAQTIEESKTFTPAYDAYNMFVKGSAQYEAVEKNPNLELPSEVLETQEERWTKIYEAAAATLKANQGKELAGPARITKAAAAMKLGKYEEAYGLYQEALKGASDTAGKAPILQGLATAQTALGKLDDAIATYESLGKLNDKFAKTSKLPRALLLEKSGKKDEAKSLYHDILESEPLHPQRSDIERRLATL